MIKKFLKWRIDIGIRVYNWGYPYTVVFRFGINARIIIYNTLYLEDLIPLIEKKIKKIFLAFVLLIRVVKPEDLDHILLIPFLVPGLLQIELFEPRCACFFPRRSIDRPDFSVSSPEKPSR